MDDRNAKASSIAEEAVGQKLGSAPPDEAKARAEMSPEEAVRRIAPGAGPQASTPEKTAESVGERVGDAYADPATDKAEKSPSGIVRRAATQAGSQASDAATRMQDAGRQATQIVSRQFGDQSFIAVVAGFALGYIAALMIHRRG